MENTHTILSELREISTLLAEANKKNVFTAPTVYFNNLAEKILEKINSVEERSYHVNSITPYKVEQGYFENFAANVLTKIKASQNAYNEVAEELNEIAPFLNTISKAPVYNLPAGFFENLKALPAVAKPEAKIISFPRRIVRYASAAIITGMMTVGSYFLIQNNSASNKANDAVASAVKNLKDEEIIDFLKTPAPQGASTTDVSEKLVPATEIKQQLKEMTDDELQQYLKENAEPGEIEVDI